MVHTAASTSASLGDATSTHHSPVPLSILGYPHSQVMLLLVSVAYMVAWFRLSSLKGPSVWSP